MNDITIEVHGFTFKVQHSGFDEHFQDLNAGVIEVDRILSSLSPARVRDIYKKAKAAEEDITVPDEILKLEKIAFETATRSWSGAKDGYIWLHAV